MLQWSYLKCLKNVTSVFRFLLNCHVTWHEKVRRFSARFTSWHSCVQACRQDLKGHVRWPRRVSLHFKGRQANLVQIGVSASSFLKKKYCIDGIFCHGHMTFARFVPKTEILPFREEKNYMESVKTLQTSTISVKHIQFHNPSELLLCDHSVYMDMKVLHVIYLTPRLVSSHLLISLQCRSSLRLV